MAATAKSLPTPPLSVGTPAKGASRVVQQQGGIRSKPIAAPLKNVLQFAADAANVEVVVFSGGQLSVGEGGVKGITRTGSTRHDDGNAADLRLYQNGKLLNWQKADDRAVMSTFVSAAVASGATGIGSGTDYMGHDGSTKMHVGFGPNGIQGGPVVTWGNGEASINTPAWLLTAVSPAAVQQTVMTLQASLKALGYLDGEVDGGVFGNATLSAVNAFAAARGGAQVQLAALTGQESGPAVPKPQPEVPLPNLRPRDSLANLSAHIEAGGRIGKGDKGVAVKELQQFLNARGATDSKGRPLAVDGKAGPRTIQALRNYQAEHPELRKDGVTGPRTLAAMLADVRERQGIDRGNAAASDRLQAQADAINARTADENAVVTGGATVTDAARLVNEGISGLSAAHGALAATAVGYSPDFSEVDPYNPGGFSPLGIDTNSPIWKSFSPETQQLVIGNRTDRQIDAHNNAVTLQSALNQKVKDLWANALDPAGLVVDNAIRPHDAMTDPYRLGGVAQLGAAGGVLSAEEHDSVHGAIRGAADAIRNPAAAFNNVFGFGSAIASPRAPSAAADVFALGGAEIALRQSGSSSSNVRDPVTGQVKQQQSPTSWSTAPGSSSSPVNQTGGQVKQQPSSGGSSQTGGQVKQQPSSSGSSSSGGSSNAGHGTSSSSLSTRDSLGTKSTSVGNSTGVTFNGLI